MKPTWRRLGLEGKVSGPIGKKTSFFADFEIRKWTENSFVKALTLNDTCVLSVRLREMDYVSLGGRPLLREESFR